jgi:hypothetical protein
MKAPKWLQTLVASLWTIVLIGLCIFTISSKEASLLSKFVCTGLLTAILLFLWLVFYLYMTIEGKTK